MAKRAVVPEGKQRLKVDTGVYLKRSGRYQATYVDPGGHRRWREFDAKQDAVRWRAQGLLDPWSLQSGKRTLQEVWDDFLQHHGPALRPSTRANWEQEWRKHIQPAIANWPIGKITIPSVKDFLADLERARIGAATRAKCRAILHRVLEEAVENREISSNPVAARGTRVKLPQKKKARVLSPAEVARVVEGARLVAGDSDALAIETMCWLGLRIGEMAGLQAGDIDVGRGEITIRRTASDLGGKLIVQEATKTNRYRVLPVPTDLPLWEKLVDHLRERGLIGKAHVFQPRDGAVIRPNNWRRRVWARAMEMAEIENPPTPHSGRRTTASLLSSAGVPPATVQAILGHSTLQQTGEYIDVSRSEMERGLQLLSDLYDSSRRGFKGR
jgi:integrase